MRSTLYAYNGVNKMYVFTCKSNDNCARCNYTCIKSASVFLKVPGTSRNNNDEVKNMRKSVIQIITLSTHIFTCQSVDKLQKDFFLLVNI